MPAIPAAPPSPSGQVIPFPRSAPLPPEAACERLERALRALDTAVQAQRAAVAGWRASMASLDGTVGALSASLHAYHARLGGLGSEVAGTADRFRALEAWADRAIALAAAHEAKKALSSAPGSAVST